MEVNAVKSISGHAGAIYDVLLSSENNCFTTSADKYVAKWKMDEGTQDKFTAKLEFSGFRIALNLSNNLLAIGNSKGGIHVIDLISKQEVRLLSQHQSAIFSLTYCPQTNEFYSGDSDGFFCVWNGDNFDLKLILPLDCGKIRNIAINEQASHIALSCQDGQVRILDTQFFNEQFSLHAHKTGANCSIFSGDILYTGGKDAHIASWDWKSGKRLHRIPAHNFAVYDFTLMGNNKTLVSASFDKTIKLWDAESLTIQKRLEKRDGGHSHVVNRLAKINEHKFISVGDDRQIIVWEINK
jgi:WD40 repeat protein